jgi:hypothetical protein
MDGVAGAHGLLGSLGARMAGGLLRVLAGRRDHDATDSRTRCPAGEGPEAWCERYRTLFVDYALERGWRQDIAEEWAWDYAGKAWAARGNRSASDMAQADVVQIEIKADAYA